MGEANMLPIQREISEGFRPPMLIQKMHIKPLLNTKLICHNLIRFDMAHYIDADKLISEIERKRDNALERQKNLEKIGQETVLNEMIAAELNRLISFVTSLQQEQPEVDLEKELEEEIERFYRTDEYRIADALGRGFETLARHFAEWGARHSINWGDVQLLDTFILELSREEKDGADWGDSEKFYTEVLRRFHEFNDKKIPEIVAEWGAEHLKR